MVTISKNIVLSPNFNIILHPNEYVTKKVHSSCGHSSTVCSISTQAICLMQKSQHGRIKDIY